MKSPPSMVSHAARPVLARLRRALLHSILFAALPLAALAQAEKPNIIFIMADDLGYGELGSYGQKLIQTPNLDRMAKEGMRFTQFYAGDTVCAPSRSVLMTGLHMGHTRVRGNADIDQWDAQNLTAADVTVPEVLKQAGYATGLVGKWGLGEDNSDGAPWRKGFDYFYGMLNQYHAHNNYPDFVWRNDQKVQLPNDLVPITKVPGTGYSKNCAVFAGDLYATEAQAFIERNKEHPFFLYLALIAPHANDERAEVLGEGNEVPDQQPYADRSWNDSLKNHAAAVTRMDRDIGALLAQLKRLAIDERTLVIFASDNGPHDEGGPQYSPEFFQASGPLRGTKQDMYEGGIRVPLIARWPGRIKPGTESGHVGYFGDIMTTFAELTGTRTPANLDSISFAPTLLGRGTQAKHDYLYWEYYEEGVSQAVLLDGRWKAVRLHVLSAPIELYDLQNDLGETTNVAGQNPAIVARAAEIIRTSHVPNEYWKLTAPPDPYKPHGTPVTSGGGRPPKLLFKSGFEEGVTLNPDFDMYRNGGWQDIEGVDSATRFTWPPRLGVPATTRFQMIVGKTVDAATMKRDYIENRIDTVIGHRGTPSRALYQLIKNTNEDFCCTQDTFMLEPKGEPGDMYVCFWIKLQPDLLEKNANSWKAFFEWKTKGDYRISTGINTRDGKAYWRTQGDNVANGNLAKEIFWRIEDPNVPVPIGEWFKYEVFWHRGAGDDGRAWAAVNGKVIADHRGPLMGVHGDPINRIMIPNLYQGGAAPHYQWVDDLEIWDGFPPAGDNPPYAPHAAAIPST